VRVQPQRQSTQACECPVGMSLHVAAATLAHDLEMFVWDLTLATN